MRLPDELLDCVCFLCVKSGNNFALQGTAFLVSVPSEVHAEVNYIYVVTAKHCVVAGEKAGGLYVRMNTVDGKSGFVKISSSTPWVSAADPGADVAAFAWAPPAEKFQYRVLPLSMAATPERIAEHGIGIGDDLSIVGLFVKRSGQRRNIPIVRSGIISSMPVEPLHDTKTGLDYHAYIAEVRSIGGLSGSPVFAVLVPGRPHAGKLDMSFKFFLLGLVRGHWDHDNKDVLPLAAGDTSGGGGNTVNMGMAVITPVETLMTIINGEAMTKMRKRADDERSKNLSS